MGQLAAISSTIIGISAILTFYTALLHLSRKKRSKGYLFRVIRDIILGVQTLQLFIIARGSYLQNPYLLFPFITLLFVSGPLNFIRYHMFFFPRGETPTRTKLQLIPPAIIFLWETWFYFINPADTSSIIQDIFIHPSNYWITYVIVLGIIVSLIQNGLLLRLELGFIRKKGIREPVIISSTITTLNIMNTLIVSIGFVLSFRNLMLFGILLMGLTGITYLLFENRYPGFYQLVAREERKKSYKKSLLKGISKGKITARLEELMEVEQLYNQLDLKLVDVADLLLITPHQLSEFLNENKQINFTTFINQYRIEEAKRALIEDKELTILEIGLRVGFGSKQSFNANFKKLTEMTPTEYRARN